ncbi:hypothetical protein FE782_11300 [Paenibacillus antri]|uniref:Type II secretion system protein GspF domain-containing protein n=1 Tax=Paenibacillus antri TaxID=2582848 RepID=A0A5R9G6E9_9BACL|nr:hypothetical protein [Paenibacillus antri]TLS51962.1 hypothetical protein FE782_11300 [Paenibacillus antri]
MKWLWMSLFAVGAALAWGALLKPLARSRSNTVKALIERYWRKEKEQEGEAPSFPELSADERAFLEKARLAGVGWTYRGYRWGRRGAALAGAYLWLAAALPNAAGFAGTVRAMLGGAAVAGLGWLAPAAAIAILAARRRALVLGEISKFAHRLSICMTDQTDMRELILRAGRPMRLLKPALQQLAAQWGNDQREAILAFKDAVGISEAYPLVNAFAAVSRAKSKDVKRLLTEHSKSIDATLEAELSKRIENAPIWISFYIMIPFLVCLVLFVYPWMLTVLEQLTVSFTA